MNSFQFLLSSKLKSLIVVSIIVVLSACTSTTSHKATVTPDEYKSEFKNVIINELYVPEELADKKEAIAFLENKIKALFSSNGINVLSEQVYEDAFEKNSMDYGGFIDPVSGNRDDAKYAAIRSDTFSDLGKKQQVDSILFIELRYRQAEFKNYRAIWDGQEEPYKLNNSELSKFLSVFKLNQDETAPALSLVVFLKDMQDAQIYYGAAGIQLLAKMNNEGEFMKIPEEQVLADQSTLESAVNRAFSRLFYVPTE